MAKFKTVIFDISGVLVDARSKFCRKIDVCMECARLQEHDFSFEELLMAFGRDAFDKLFEDKIKNENLRGRLKDDFYRTWGKIPEFYPGNISMFDDVIPTLNRLSKEGFIVVFATRLAREYCEILREELKRIGVEETEGIEMYEPTEEERFSPNCMDLVFKRVIKDTEPPRVYIDDSINRMALMKADRFDPEIYCIGSTCGFFGESLLKQNGADKVVNNLSQMISIIVR